MQAEQDLEPLLGVQQNRLGQTLSDSDGIDSKSLAILGANIAIIIFIDQAKLGLSAWALVALYLPFALSFILDVMSIWPRKYLTAVTLSQAPEYLDMDRENLILQLLSDTTAAIEHNEQLNRTRLRWCIFSTVLTGFGFLALLFIL